MVKRRLSWQQKQVGIIRVLADDPAPLTGYQVARALGYRNSREVRPVLDALHEVGFVAQIGTSDDHAEQRYWWTLTDAGREYAAELRRDT